MTKSFPPRRLHLVDVENLLGCARPTLASAADCRERYAECVPAGTDDLVIVACNHGAALEVGRRWTGAKDIAARFEAVVVASGDGGFADAVAWLRGLEIDVTVVSNGRSLSRKLRLAAKHVLIFDADPLPARPARLHEAA